MELPIEAVNFKVLRDSLGLTQSEFGEKLNIKTTADIERGKTRITGEVVKELFKQYNINPLWLYGESKKKIVSTDQILPKVISTNEMGEENILLVHEKAAAGYGQNIGDTQFYADLPAFTFPLFEYRNATFRGFQIAGDSMLPLVHPGDWVLAKAVPSIEDIKEEQVYVIVEQESIRLKKIKKNNGENTISLISTNVEYPPIKINTEGILEIWEYHSKISIGNEKLEQVTLESLHQDILELKNSMK